MSFVSHVQGGKAAVAKNKNNNNKKCWKMSRNRKECMTRGVEKEQLSLCLPACVFLQQPPLCLAIYGCQVLLYTTGLEEEKHCCVWTRETTTFTYNVIKILPLVLMETEQKLLMFITNKSKLQL